MIARLFLLALTLILLGCGSKEDKALTTAASNGDVEEMRRLIDRGANINAVVLDDLTPLTVAAKRGRIDAVRLLIASGANVHKPSGDLSPLFFAASNGHVAVVRLLLESGAS
jgi:ankyrin repeat protein